MGAARRVGVRCIRGLKGAGHGDPLGVPKPTQTTDSAVAHDEQLVADVIDKATPLINAFLATQPEERRQRLDGLQEIVDNVLRLLEPLLFGVLFAWLSVRADAVAGTCRICSRRCTRERKTIKVRTKRLQVPVPVTRYRCRACGTNRAPMREWLGVTAGMTTSGFDRAATALATEMSFGRAAHQLEEQHGHAVDRTLVERRTYAIGEEAIEFLAERRTRRRSEVMDAVGHRPGVDRVLLQVDGGGVPVGTLTRPSRADATELTPVRGLPKGRRPKTKREVRVAMAWQDGVVEARAVDLHIAPHNQTEVSGARLYHVALEAGAGDDTHVHLTCDMAPWHRNQFEEQFSAQQNRSLCADFYHTLEYIAAAGRAVEHADEASSHRWLATQARRLKSGERAAIIDEWKGHSCGGGTCPTNDHGECAVRAARRYLRRFGEYMDYPRFIDEGLTIGSGAVEGRIRHLVRRRLDVPGDWKEDNLHPMLALISVRESGLWDEFWQWRDDRDRQRFRGRLQGIGLNRFRGNLTPARPDGTATERIDLDDLSPCFAT